MWGIIGGTTPKTHFKLRKIGACRAVFDSAPSLHSTFHHVPLRPDTPYLFVTERKGPLTTSAVRKIIARAGESAKIGMPIHPHMLRHSTGYKLANDGHDTRAIQHYLGHKNIHTVRYTELAAGRFNDFWTD